MGLKAITYNMNKKHINPTTLFNSTDFGFSQIVISGPGKLVFISGQVAWDKNRKIVGANDLKVQAKKTFENLKIAIEAAGGTVQDIVMLRIYVVNYKAEDASIIGEELRQCFGTEHPPASTWIGVTALANKDFLLEVEAQAVLSS